MAQDRSVDLEHGEYEENVELIIQDGIKAIEETEEGYLVNLVTPNKFGNPLEYLAPVLDIHFKDTIRYQFMAQCGCGGYVLRVWRKN